MVLNRWFGFNKVFYSNICDGKEIDLTQESPCIVGTK